MHAQIFNLIYEGAIHVNINAEVILLHIRRSMPNEGGILQPSFKVAVNLSPHEVLAIATKKFVAVSYFSRDQHNQTDPNHQE